MEIKGEGIEEAVTAVLDWPARHLARSTASTTRRSAASRARASPYRLGLLFEDSVDDAVELMAEYGAPGCLAAPEPDRSSRWSSACSAPAVG